AAEHLKEAHALIDDPIRRAETALQLGRQLYFLRRGEEADAVFTRALDELAGVDSELEVLLEVGLIINEWFVPSRQRRARELLERVRSRLSGETVGEKHLLALVAFHDARAVASSAAATVPLAIRALSGGMLVREEITGAGFIGA